MQIQTLRERLRAHGANPRHEHRVLRLWSQALPQNHGARDITSFMPARLRQALPEMERDLAELATVVTTHPGEDGSSRQVVALADGQLVESVLMPPDASRHCACPHRWVARWAACSA